MISQAFKGNTKNTFKNMHPSTPLPKQQQAMCACRSSAGVGAGSRDRVTGVVIERTSVSMNILKVGKWGLLTYSLAWTEVTWTTSH